MSNGKGHSAKKRQKTNDKSVKTKGGMRCKIEVEVEVEVKVKTQGAGLGKDKRQKSQDKNQINQKTSESK